MSQTPRTDKEAIGFARILVDRDKSELIEIIPSDFARQLERELNQANAKIAKYQALVRVEARLAYDLGAGREIDYIEKRIAEIESA